MTQPRLTHLVLIRQAQDGKVTKGELQTEAGERICYTLEEPWKDNVPFISCIPTGRYWIKKHISQRHGQCFAVIDVPGRSDVQIHAGNQLTQTEGCILVGLREAHWPSGPAVASSVRAIEKLYLLLGPVTELEIREAEPG